MAIQSLLYKEPYRGQVPEGPPPIFPPHPVIAVLVGNTPPASTSTCPFSPLMPLVLLSCWILLSPHWSAQGQGLVMYFLPLPSSRLHTETPPPQQDLRFPHLTDVTKPFGSRKCWVTLLRPSNIYQIFTLTFVFKDEDDLDPSLKVLTVNEGSKAQKQISIIK